MPRGLRHVALSISFLSPIARLPVAFFAKKMASLIFRPDLRFLALTSFQSLNRPSLSSGSSSRISLLKQSFSVSLARRRPPGNIHSLSRLLLTNKARPRFAATSLDDFAIPGPCRSRASRAQCSFWTTSIYCVVSAHPSDCGTRWQGSTDFAKFHRSTQQAPSAPLSQLASERISILLASIFRFLRNEPKGGKNAQN